MAVDLKQLEKFVREQSMAFIGSVDAEGFPNAKAMLLPRQQEGLKVFYFSTNTSSLRVKQYRENPKSCVYFYRKGLVNYQGLMLRGAMEVLEDAATKEMIWRPGDRVFYPLGVTDPDYCVLRFTATDGRYYRDLWTESFSV